MLSSPNRESPSDFSSRYDDAGSPARPARSPKQSDVRWRRQLHAQVPGLCLPALALHGLEHDREPCARAGPELRPELLGGQLLPGAERLPHDSLLAALQQPVPERRDRAAAAAAPTSPGPRRCQLQRARAGGGAPGQQRLEAVLRNRAPLGAPRTGHYYGGGRDLALRTLS